MKNIIKKLVKLYTNEHGFTLIEIIVATTVFVSATMLFMGVFSTISNNTLLIENTRLAQQDARYAIEQVSREIRQGWNYEVSPDGTKLTYDTCVDGALESSTLEWINDDEKGSLVKTTVMVEEDVTSSLSDIEYLKFTLDQPAGMYPLVVIEMKLKRTEYTRFANELEFTTKVGSRVREQVEGCGK